MGRNTKDRLLADYIFLKTPMYCAYFLEKNNSAQVDSPCLPQNFFVESKRLLVLGSAIMGVRFIHHSNLGSMLRAPFKADLHDHKRLQRRRLVMANKTSIDFNRPQVAFLSVFWVILEGFSSRRVFLPVFEGFLFVLWGFLTVFIGFR